MNKTRPKHLSLHQTKLPLPGIISILHCISGLSIGALSFYAMRRKDILRGM